MNKKSIFLGIVLIVIFVITIGCSKELIEDWQDKNNKLPQQNVEQPGDEANPIIEQINNMSMDQKIGQMVIVGLDGYTLDDNAKEMINNYYVGGFIFFGNNVENSQQLLKLINDLKSENIKNNIPLFFSIDEEGGIVSRMPDEFTKIPSNRIIGQKNDKTLSYNIGSVIAEQIKSFGFNMNFAPVLDIDSNPNNPVIGKRAFGSNEKIVSELGIETMKGIQSKGVISVVKHFPGHGDTSVDSHIGLPIVDKELNNLMQFELIPFIKAIENNADAVMVAHILFNRIDPNNPATLSKPIINELLREELGFNGVVITDNMTMGAIMENYDIEDAVVKSVNAGSDIVLVCHGYENQVKALKALKKAVENGMISEERIDQSVYRILELKNKYNLKDDIITNVDIDKINSAISKTLSTNP